MRSAGPHVCPRCGERVSAFAAGCALCGAALDPRRGRCPSRRVDRFLAEIDRFFDPRRPDRRKRRDPLSGN